MGNGNLAKLRNKALAVALTSAILVPVSAVVANAAPVVSTYDGYGWAVVTTDTNIRACSSSTCSIIGSLYSGSRVNVVGTDWGYSAQLGRNVHWSRISSGGWVRSDLLRRNYGYGNYVVSDVNVRSGPGSNYAMLRSLSAGTPIRVVDRAYGWSDAAGRSVLWYRISGGGWVNASYVGTR